MAVLQQEGQGDGTARVGADQRQPCAGEGREQVLPAAGSMDRALDHGRTQDGGRLPDASQGGGATTAERGGTEGRLAPKRGGGPVQQLLDSGGVQTQVAGGPADNAGGRAASSRSSWLMRTQAVSRLRAGRSVLPSRASVR